MGGVNDGDRPNPDALLAALQTEAARTQRRAAQGVRADAPRRGQNYAMLKPPSAN